MRKTLLMLAAGVAVSALSAAWASAQSLDESKQGGSMTVTYKDDV